MLTWLWHVCVIYIVCPSVRVSNCVWVLVCILAHFVTPFDKTEICYQAKLNVLLGNSPGDFLPSIQPQMCHVVQVLLTKVTFFFLSELCKQGVPSGARKHLKLSFTTNM